VNRQIELAQAQKLLCQYGPSAGVINSVLQQYLAVDEQINTRADRIIVTNGCQEALTLLCLHELKDDKDCMLVLDPAYIGFSGLLRALNKHMEAIDITQICDLGNKANDGFDWQYLRQRVDEIRAQGLNPKAIYINPDFNNPLAYRLSQEARLAFLSLCHQLEIKVIEDNPYSRFDYTNQPVLSLKALDKDDIVYHIGSFSKTFCPTIRVGFIVLPDSAAHTVEALVALKSLISLNTSSVVQGIVAGYLLDNEFSLTRRMQTLVPKYQQQRDALVRALERYLSDRPGIHWNIPQGGFFTVVELPFDFTADDVFSCAEQEKVIVMPVGFFSVLPQRWQGKIRLAFSNFDPKINIHWS
jgi:(S)-3,5-dihydroxyphenylglycine transaminase